MAKSIKLQGLNKTANSYVNRLDQFEKLKEIANRKNYPHKIKQLRSRIQQEYNFWTLKEPSRKLEDLTKDLIFIQSQIESNLDKERIDVLTEKYGIK